MTAGYLDPAAGTGVQIPAVCVAYSPASAHFPVGIDYKLIHRYLIHRYIDIQLIYRYLLYRYIGIRLIHGYTADT